MRCVNAASLLTCHIPTLWDWSFDRSSLCGPRIYTACQRFLEQISFDEDFWWIIMCFVFFQQVACFAVFSLCLFSSAANLNIKVTYFLFLSTDKNVFDQPIRLYILDLLSWQYLLLCLLVALIVLVCVCSTPSESEGNIHVLG